MAEFDVVGKCSWIAFEIITNKNARAMRAFLFGFGR